MWLDSPSGTRAELRRTGAQEVLTDCRSPCILSQSMLTVAA